MAANFRKEVTSSVMWLMNFNLRIKCFKVTPFEYDGKYLLDIEVSRVLEFESGLFEFIDTKYPEIPESIKTNKVLTEDNEKLLVKAIEEFKSEF